MRKERKLAELSLFSSSFFVGAAEPGSGQGEDSRVGAPPCPIPDEPLWPVDSKGLVQRRALQQARQQSQFPRTRVSGRFFVAPLTNLLAERPLDDAAPAPDLLNLPSLSKEFGTKK